MSSQDQEDTDKVWDMSDLPEDLRKQTPALVEHGSLPALPLVSHDWNEAANLAVRQLKRQPGCQAEQFHPQRQPAQVRLIGERWPIWSSWSWTWNVRWRNLARIAETWSHH